MVNKPIQRTMSPVRFHTNVHLTLCIVVSVYCLIYVHTAMHNAIKDLCMCIWWDPELWIASYIYYQFTRHNAHMAEPNVVRHRCSQNIVIAQPRVCLYYSTHALQKFLFWHSTALTKSVLHTIYCVMTESSTIAQEEFTLAFREIHQVLVTIVH